ncbi:hypothetical protein GH714_043250 [Hevea brasiliensis]|uniref:FAD-binding domain-containing protein n=1 Tax=Hevea brasiliensis TaxID=3981 RepID=A0A6A6K3Q4_HEVBR|nr:hypothetical protein GH714_043250 [Hevea brasiliensis]
MEIVGDGVIIGAGIAGLATAVALKRVGVRALILEKSDPLRSTGAALTLFPNAWLALDALGVSDKLTSLYTPFSKYGSITDVATGAVQEVLYTGNGGKAQGPILVHRKALLEALAKELPADQFDFLPSLLLLNSKNSEMFPLFYFI